MKLFKSILFAGVWLMAAPMLVLATHPNHVSLAEIEFNAKSGNFEVALCVHPEDLEQALKQIHQQLDSDKKFSFNEATVGQLVPALLEKEFVLLAAENDAQCDIRWVGCELDVKKAWLFFEIQGQPGKRRYQLANRIFLQHNEDQINHVKFKHGAQIEWLQSSRAQPKVRLEVPQ